MPRNPPRAKVLCQNHKRDQSNLPKLSYDSGISGRTIRRAEWHGGGTNNRSWKDNILKMEGVAAPETVCTRRMGGSSAGGMFHERCECGRFCEDSATNAWHGCFRWDTIAYETGRSKLIGIRKESIWWKAWGEQRSGCEEDGALP